MTSEDIYRPTICSLAGPLPFKFHSPATYWWNYYLHSEDLSSEGDELLKYVYDKIDNLLPNYHKGDPYHSFLLNCTRPNYITFNRGDTLQSYLPEHYRGDPYYNFLPNSKAYDSDLFMNWAQFKCFKDLIIKTNEYWEQSQDKWHLKPHKGIRSVGVPKIEVSRVLLPKTCQKHEESAFLQVRWPDLRLEFG